MSGSTIFLLAAVLLLGAETASAQSTQQIDHPVAQTMPETAGIGTLQGDEAGRTPEGRAPADGERATASPPEKDETVGVGGSVDVAPRDIREPFDE